MFGRIDPMRYSFIDANRPHALFIHSLQLLMSSFNFVHYKANLNKQKVHGCNGSVVGIVIFFIVRKPARAAVATNPGCYSRPLLI